MSKGCASKVTTGEHAAVIWQLPQKIRAREGVLAAQPGVLQRKAY